jgi:sugar phosphate permease
MFERIDRKRLNAYLQVILLALAASVIYSAPYLRQLFKTSLLDAFSLTELQLGNLSTMYAICSIVCYLPGGWIADRVAPRILVIIALFSSAATYAWYATIPGYVELLIIHGLWGVIGVGVLWAAMFKHIRLLAGGDEQGRMFGTLEGARGLFEAILLTVATFVFTLFATRKLGMINVIVIYTVFAAGLGILMLFVKSDPGTQTSDAAEKIHLADILLIVRQPSIWLLCIILTAVYHVFWATIEFPSFAETGGFAMPLAAATALGATKLWMRPPGGILAGMVGDRIGNVHVMEWLFTGAILACLYLALVPATPDLAWTLWIFIFPFGLLAYGLRGVFWALLYECPVPARVLGTAIGFISIMGYSSDAYIPQVSAYLQSNYETGTAYQLFFAYVAAAALVGLAASWVLGSMARPEPGEEMPA